MCGCHWLWQVKASKRVLDRKAHNTVKWAVVKFKDTLRGAPTTQREAFASRRGRLESAMGQLSSVHTLLCTVGSRGDQRRRPASEKLLGVLAAAKDLEAQATASDLEGGHWL